jgi:hypothetical protein
LKHEIRWKTLAVPRHGLVEGLSGYAVEPGEIGVKEDFFPAYREHCVLDSFL